MRRSRNTKAVRANTVLFPVETLSVPHEAMTE